jgi:hypothetical protein
VILPLASVPERILLMKLNAAFTACVTASGQRLGRRLRAARSKVLIIDEFVTTHREGKAEIVAPMDGLSRTRMIVTTWI